MADQPEIATVTTIRYSNIRNPIERVRSEVFLDTARHLKELRMACVAVCDACPDAYLERVRELGVLTVPQTGQGMGVVRREAIEAGVSRYPGATYYVWFEPEKPDLPFRVGSLVDAMRREKSALGLFNRVRMENYPEEQIHYYLFCRTVATKLLGFDLDYAFGPMVLTKESTSYFLNYAGEYGDLWEDLFIPRLRIIKAGLGVTVNPSSFVNDPRMNAVETGNPGIILKRVAQLNNVIPSLISEWQRLSE